MKENIDKNYAEKIPNEELDGEPGRVCYIPHHGVYHPRKQKLCVVFDCSSSYKGAGLNHELLQGLDLTSSLIGVLLRFMEEHIALMADIKGMFQQVHIPKPDRDFLRFVWWPNGDTEKPLEEYRMRVHVFGAMSSPTCANFALRKTAEDASNRYHQSAVDTVLRISTWMTV